MEHFQQSIQVIDLTNTSFLLNRQSGFHQLIQGKLSKMSENKQSLSVDKTKKQYLFTINFDFIQVEPLTPLKRQIKLFQLYLGLEYQVQANLKLSKLFDFDSLLYFLEIDTNFKNNELSEKGFVKVQTIPHQAYLKHQIEINYFSTQRFNVQNSFAFTLILGNKQNNWPFVVENFKSKITMNQNQKKSNQEKNPLIKNLYIHNDFSYPLISNLQLPQKYDKTKLLQKINLLDEYSSPKTPPVSQKQLYICHDMKGGYIEDIKSYTPFRDHSKTHNYRFNYLNETKIFNYFSHYPITIPPKMWRDLCKKYNVSCLGTFIVQNNDFKINQQDFLTDQFALKLIYIARKAKFDGYLINIQININNTEKLVRWLEFLTKQMNSLIPNSQIIWYDSVIMDGRIQYQNQLNNKNKPFYQVCNGIFTNYWWQQSSLKHSINHKIKDKSIYIGNDCFGRNTYGGGKYNIVKAINKIHQIGKYQLGIALFAPGYTYQDNGETQRHQFIQNQMKMYHGSNVVTKIVSKWRYTLNGGQGWKIQDQWAVTSYQSCKRQALIKINQFQGQLSTLKIYFSCVVKGTGPNYADFYNIRIQVYDYKNDFVYLEEVFPKTIASVEQQLVQLRLEIDSQIIQQTVCIRILEEGKDAEYWAGNYGSRFKGEKVILMMESNDKNWMRDIPLQLLHLKSNYITFFNKGEGNNWNYFGQKMQSLYNKLSDYDFPPIYSLNNVTHVQIYHQDAFVGGSCLRFQNTKRICINKYNPIQNQSGKYTSILVVKGCVPAEIKHGDVKAKYEKYEIKGIKTNGWEYFISQLTFNHQKQDKVLQIWFQKQFGLIGQFSLIQSELYNRENTHHSNLVHTQIKIRRDKKRKHTLPYHVDLIVQSQSPKIDSCSVERLLIKIGEFSGFIQLQRTRTTKQQFVTTKLSGLLKDLPIATKKVNQIQFIIIDIKNCIPKIVLQQTINNNLLSKLIQDHQVKFQCWM